MKRKLERWVKFHKYYEVSNYGKVRSLERVVVFERRYKGGTRALIRKHLKSVELSYGLAGCGYPVVVLACDGKNKMVYVHRVVAEAFVPNPKNCPEVNHLDGNKQNNYYKNLKWVTRLANEKHSHRLGLNSRSKRTGRFVGRRVA